MGDSNVEAALREFGWFLYKVPGGSRIIMSGPEHCSDMGQLALAATFLSDGPEANEFDLYSDPNEARRVAAAVLRALADDIESGMNTRELPWLAV